MVVQTGTGTSNEIKEFQGKNADVTVTDSVISISTPSVLAEKNTGSTFYCVDSPALYVWHIDKWYTV